MTELTFVTYILFAHWICDYIIQTRTQGNNKHRSIKQLFYHVSTYTIGLMILLIIGNMTNFQNQLSIVHIIEYSLVNFGLHFVVDYFTSKSVKRLWESKKEYQTFIMMGLDQLIHAYCLIGTYKILFSGL